MKIASLLESIFVGFFYFLASPINLATLLELLLRGSGKGVGPADIGIAPIFSFHLFHSGSKLYK
jgi:hypothetical protein